MGAVSSVFVLDLFLECKAGPVIPEGFGHTLENIFRVPSYSEQKPATAGGTGRR